MKDMFICYNWFPMVADHVVDLPESFYTKHGISRLHSCDHFDPKSVGEGDVIFVKTDFIVNGYFNKNVLPYLNKKFSLITGISSYQLGRDDAGAVSEILANKNLNKLFCVHPPAIEDDKIVPLPIGFEEKERDGGNQNVINFHYHMKKKFSLKKSKVLLPYHTLSTNPERSNLISLLSQLPFVEIQKEKLSFTDYLSLLNDYKFVICLEGSGPDLHRNYEALLVDSIPINIKNVISNLFDYHDVPGVFLDSWFQLNKEKYEQILNFPYNCDNIDKFLRVEHHTDLIRSLS
tara:strand:+ start:297 stop:1166 length:870 start_codon:yes stop_codon:yes gene_type:complete